MKNSTAAEGCREGMGAKGQERKKKDI